MSASSSLVIRESGADVPVGDAQRAEALAAELREALVDLVPHGGDVRRSRRRPSPRSSRPRARSSSAPLVTIRCRSPCGDQDAQPLADEVVGHLVQLLVAGHVERTVGADRLVDRIGEARLEEGVEVGVEQDLLALLALARPARSARRTTPSVSVPVLSEQSTFMLPKFSMDARRLTITFAGAMRLAPWARLMLMIAGSSCGVSPTASAREKRKDSRTGRWK